MKKAIALIALAVLLAGGAAAQDQTSKLSVVVSGSLLFPSDSNYRDTYGSARFYPEIRVAYALSKGFFLYAGYGLLAASGTTPGLEVDASSTQHVFSLGGGIGGPLTGKLSYKAGLGLFLDAYKEKAMDIEVTGSAIGFRVDAGLCYSLTPKISAQVGLGYLAASDTTDDDVSIKLGGFRLGAGVGYKF
ncbi:MAG: outer membrane beta-barrel protein [Acidobacteriota bacterium]|nr:outer membrane beta-barrel protein [Acidobacteriota bacterium]